MLRKIFEFLFPPTLWTKRFIFWWVVSLATLLVFDILWMAQTTFRPFCFVAFYPYLLLNTTLLSLPALLSRRTWIQALVLLIADIILIANLMYCLTYFNGIPAESYLLLGNLADFTDSVTNSFRWYYAVLPLITVAAWALSSRFIDVGGRRPRVLPYLVTLLVLCIWAWAADAWRGQSLMERVEVMKNECHSNLCIVPVYQISGYVVFDLLAGNESLSPETEQNVNSWLETHKSLTEPYYAGKVQADSLRHPRNLIVILCESLESWVLEKDVEGKEITPNLNKLLKEESTFFAPGVMTQTGHGRSIDGQLLVLSGLLPHSSRVYAFQQPDNLYFTLPKAMKQHGGRSTLLTGDSPHVWNQRLVAQAFGFDSLIHRSSWDFSAPGATIKRSLSDGALMQQSVEKLKNGEIFASDSPELLMWVTHSGHHPFKVGNDLKRIDFNGKYSESITDYMTAANYTDYAIGILIDYLKTRPDWKETMVVITGDHEGLSKLRDKAMKDSNSAAFVDPYPHTPLIILNSPVPGRFDGEMGQVDIYSSVLDLMGWYDYPWKGLGQSVFDPAFPRAAYSSKLGTVVGAEGLNPAIVSHLKDGAGIGCTIIQYDMLNK